MTDRKEGNSSISVLSPQKVLDLYYLDTRWHILEIGAMLDRMQRGEIAHPDDEASRTDLRAELLREALQILASDSREPDRAERLLTLFTKLDRAHADSL